MVNKIYNIYKIYLLSLRKKNYDKIIIPDESYGKDFNPSLSKPFWIIPNQSDKLFESRLMQIG